VLECAFIYVLQQTVYWIFNREADCTNFWENVGRYLRIVHTLSLSWSVVRLLGSLATAQVTLSAGLQEEEPGQEELLPQSLDQLQKEEAESWGTEHVWGNNLSGNSSQNGVYPILPRSSVLGSQVPKNM